MVLTANLCTNAQQRQQVTQSEALTVAQRLLISSGNRTQNLIHKKTAIPQKKCIFALYKQHKIAQYTKRKHYKTSS